jgi:hypothetical protein
VEERMQKEKTGNEKLKSNKFVDQWRGDKMKYLQ